MRFLPSLGWSGHLLKFVRLEVDPELGYYGPTNWISL